MAVRSGRAQVAHAVGVVAHFALNQGDCGPVQELVGVTEASGVPLALFLVHGVGPTRRWSRTAVGESGGEAEGETRGEPEGEAEGERQLRSADRFCRSPPARRVVTAATYPYAREEEERWGRVWGVFTAVGRFGCCAGRRPLPTRRRGLVSWTEAGFLRAARVMSGGPRRPRAARARSLSAESLARRVLVLGRRTLNFTSAPSGRTST